MDPLKSAPGMRTTEGSAESQWGWNHRATWRGLGLLAAAVLLPFGWILPLARLAQVRAAARRRTGLPGT